MSFVKLCKTTAKIVGSRSLVGGKQFCLPVRSFSATYQDLPFMVGFEADMDPKEMKVNILKDEVRQEMFLKHMQDEELWSIEKLSNFYGTSLIRTKSVLLLMQKRHDVISKDEARMYALLGMEVPVPTSIVEQYKVAPMLKVPPLLMALHDKHKADKTLTMEALIAGYNESIAGLEDKEPLTLTPAQLDEALWIVKDHLGRQNDTETAAKYQLQDILEMKAGDVDVTFQEAEHDFSTSKAFNATNYPSQHRFKSFEDNYYPRLVGDSHVVRQEIELLKRVEFETKAQLEHDMEYYERMYAVKTPEEVLEEVRTRPLPVELKSHTPPSAEKPMSRWKIAFQDLSLSAVPKTKTTIRVPERTVMRTRKGELRYATPLEEGKRSWRVHADGIDATLNKLVPRNFERLIKPYLDADKDEKEAARLVVDRREKRKAMRLAAGVSKK